MCNLACLYWIRDHLIKDEIEGKIVIESGARDVNGSARTMVKDMQPARYIGTDIENGLGVDQLVDACDLVKTFGANFADVVISTEVVEHTRPWKSVISNYKRVLKPGGILFITTRSWGFGYHGYPGDFWRYEVADMRAIFADFEILVLESDPSEPGVFIKAKKPVQFKEKNLTRYQLRPIEKEVKSMRGNAPASHVTGVPGWESPAEQDYLLSLAQSLSENAVILEIGGEFGMSASLFSKGAPEARIYSIDIAFGGDTGEIHKANLSEAALGTNVKQIAADSQLAANVTRFKKTEKGGISLLFIDGGHDYASVLNDLKLWTPLVKPGGYLVLHDTANPENKLPHPLHHEVSKALAEWLTDNGKDWTLVKHVDSITAFKRND